METFFTADTHFGHDAIRRFCDRPFESVDEMDEALIENWNSVVAPRDVVYHLGDFSYRAAKDVRTYVKRLNGTIHLILGNHDSHTLCTSPKGLASVSDLLSINSMLDTSRSAITRCGFGRSPTTALGISTAIPTGIFLMIPKVDPSTSALIVMTIFLCRLAGVEEFMSEKKWESPFKK